jgi:hypothetical protein
LQDRSAPRTAKARLGRGHVAVLVALMSILILTIVWAASVWTAGDGVAMDKHGWIALGLGTFFSLVIGCGLMALMFFSSRSGHDEAATPKLLRDGGSLSPVDETIARPDDLTAGDGKPVDEGKQPQQSRRAAEEADARGPFETLKHLT